MKLKNYIIRCWLNLIESAGRLSFKKSIKEGKFDLWVEHDLGGGISKYCEEAIVTNKIKSKKILRLKYIKELNLYYLEKIGEKKRIYIRKEIEVINLLKSLRINTLHVHSLVSYPNLEKWLTELIKLATIEKKIFYAHDYYPICIKINLVNENNNYCKANLKHCSECLFSIDKKKFKEDPLEYRAHWHQFLNQMDDIITFSNSTKEIYQSVFPDIVEKIKLQNPYLSRLKTIVIDKKEKDTINIGVIGNINSVEKGRKVILDLAEVKDGRFKIFVYGTRQGDFDNYVNIENRGRYKVDDLPLLLQKDSIDYILIPSVCPETFSYTTTEAIMMGLPVVCFNLGAQGEKVRNYPKGILLEKKDANFILATLLKHHKQNTK